MPFDPNDEDTKTAIKQLVGEAVTNATDGLASKNSELLSKLKAANKGREIKPELVEGLEDNISQLEGDLNKSIKALKKANEAGEATSKQLSNELDASRKLAISTGLQAALNKADVAPHFVESVTAMFIGRATLDDERKVVIGDKSLSDFVSDWSQSDEGKHFVLAKGNGGGGGNGNGGGGSAKTINRAKFNEMTNTERSVFFKEGGKMTK